MNTLRNKLPPKDFSTFAEHGGSRREGQFRIQSNAPHREPLTETVKQQIEQRFNRCGLIVKKIDKTSKHYIRVAYNIRSKKNV